MQTAVLHVRENKYTCRKLQLAPHVAHANDTQVSPALLRRPLGRPCPSMPDFCLGISDKDAETSQFLRHMRLDGFERATVPFAERFVLAWQRGAPEPDMDTQTLFMVLKVCFSVFIARASVGITVCGVGPCSINCVDSTPRT